MSEEGSQNQEGRGRPKTPEIIEMMTRSLRRSVSPFELAKMASDLAGGGEVREGHFETAYELLRRSHLWLLRREFPDEGKNHR